MPHRLFVAVTVVALACGLGLAHGCTSSSQDQNYKVLEEDRPMFDTRPDPSKPGASQTAPAAGTEEASLVATAAAASGTKAVIDAPKQACCGNCGAK